jgi:hypothetical protein
MTTSTGTQDVIVKLPPNPQGRWAKRAVKKTKICTGMLKNKTKIPCKISQQTCFFARGYNKNAIFNVLLMII